MSPFSVFPVNEEDEEAKKKSKNWNNPISFHQL
jgi:hypothetical protein